VDERVSPIRCPGPETDKGGERAREWETGIEGPLQSFPSGHVVEISGPPSSGKTELLMATMIKFLLPLQLGGQQHRILFIDLDHRLDLRRLQSLILSHCLSPVFSLSEAEAKERTKETMSRLHLFFCSHLSDLVLTVRSLGPFIDRFYRLSSPSSSSSSSSSSLAQSKEKERISTLIVDGISGLRFSDIYHKKISSLIGSKQTGGLDQITLMISQLIVEYQLLAFVTIVTPSPEPESGGSGGLITGGMTSGMGTGMMPLRWRCPVFSRLSLRSLPFEDSVRRFSSFSHLFPQDQRISFFELSSSIFSLPSTRNICFVSDEGIHFLS